MQLLTKSYCSGKCVSAPKFIARCSGWWYVNVLAPTKDTGQFLWQIRTVSEFPLFHITRFINYNVKVLKIYLCESNSIGKTLHEMNYSICITVYVFFTSTDVHLCVVFRIC
jgi:hypothetical protein